jgi:hypothetical protein
VATLLCSLLAGFLFAFASVVMPGLRRLDDAAFIRALQVIDRVIRACCPRFRGGKRRDARPPARRIVDADATVVTFQHEELGVVERDDGGQPDVATYSSAPAGRGSRLSGTANAPISRPLRVTS